MNIKPNREEAHTSSRSTLNLGMFARAVQMHQNGQLKEAACLLEALLGHFPADPETLARLGVIRAQENLLLEGVELLERAIRSGGTKTSAEIYNNLGAVLSRLGRFEDAVAAYNKAIAIRQAYPVALYNLGVSLSALQRYDEAIESYEKAIAQKPGYAEALVDLANALRQNGRKLEALERLKEALEVRPNSIEACILLGHVLVDLNRLSEAVTTYQAALNQDKQNLSLRLVLANTLASLKRSDLSAKHYEEICVLDDQNATAFAGLAMCYLEQGKLKQAEEAIERAIALDPNRPAFYVALTRIRKLKPGEPHLRTMKDLVERSQSQSLEERINIHFALGKGLADIGENEQSFKHMLIGNALRRPQIEYDEAAALEQIRKIKSIFNRDFISKWEGTGVTSSVPIFIVGMPRSGSTLVEQVLSSHPDVFGAGEINSFEHVLYSMETKSPRMFFFQKVAEFTDNDFRALGGNYVKALVDCAQSQGYLGSERLITDKLLLNFRYLGLIHLALPNAKIIHISRNPIDTCLSCFSILFTQVPFSYDLGELGRYYSAYQNLMEHWRTVLPEGRFLDVSYESLVENFDVEARRILAYCSLSWDERCVEFYKAERLVHSASSFQVRQPLYKSSIKKWRPGPELLKPLLQGIKHI